MPYNYVSAQYQRAFAAKTAYLDTDITVKIVPAPIKGWDALSPQAAMEPQYAVTLDNWIPRTGWVEYRGGYNAWAQGLSTAPINTLMCYRPAGGDEQLFAASESNIWDVSSYGQPSIALDNQGGDKWQYINYGVGGGGAQYLLCVNGTDPFTAYDGTTWTTPTITNVNSADLIGINAFKRRIWFVENASSSAWYLDTDAISGAATRFDLSPLMTKGGYLMAIATWTLDGGTGPDDYICFVTSKGQIIQYKGVDPDDATTFTLQGVYNFPPPIGRRCFLRFGAETLLITQDGLIPISQALPYDPAAARSVAITNRIQNAMLTSALMYGTNYGWQVIAFELAALLILNIPQVTNSTFVQYVMNTQTGAWCSFSGWNGICFEIYNGSLYFGGVSGSVNLAYTGGLDLVDPIQATMKCAFNYFEEPGRIKNVNLIRPLLVADGTLTPTIGIDVDFGDVSLTAPASVLTPSGAIWDLSDWDESTWSSGTVTVTNWLSATAVGTALAVKMLVNLIGNASTVNASSVFDTGVFDTAVFDGNGSISSSGLGIPILQCQLFEMSMEYGGPI